MSCTELHIGKIKKLDLQNRSIEEWAEEISKVVGIGLEESYCDSYEELIKNELYDKYIIVKDEVYEVIEDEELEDGEISTLTPEENDIFSFTMRFYNGGTYLTEMLEDAIKQYNNGR